MEIPKGGDFGLNANPYSSMAKPTYIKSIARLCRNGPPYSMHDMELLLLVFSMMLSPPLRGFFHFLVLPFRHTHPEKKELRTKKSQQQESSWFCR